MQKFPFDHLQAALILRAWNMNAISHGYIKDQVLARYMWTESFFMALAVVES